MKLFRTPKAILAEISALGQAEHDRREDRAAVAEFYAGSPPLSQEDADARGLSVNVSHLFGYSELDQAAGQMFGLYTRPTRFFQVELDAAPPSDRLKWEMEASTSFNEAVKSSRRFKPAYEGCCGDATLHGESIMFFPNCTDWAPSQAALSNILVPDDAPADVLRQTHWNIEGDLSLSDIHKYVEGDLPGWKVGNLRKCLAEIYKEECTRADLSVDTLNPEKLEYERQTNSGRESLRRVAGIKVDYFYQVRADKRGCPVDLTILIHRSENMPPGFDDNDRVLFETESYYESISDVLHPMFMDTMLGGSKKWHRVLGLGHLNYQLNFAVELLLNVAMQGTLEANMNLWKAKDSAQREEIQQILLRHNGIIPEGVDLIQQRFVPPQEGTIGMIQFMRQQASKNARGTTANLGEAKILEQQFLAEQNTQKEANSGRVSNWYDYLDRLGAKMFERFCNPFIRPWDAGYSDICKFQGRMERLGIPLYYLQPHNVKVSAVRLLGDGDTQKAQTGALFLTQNRAMYPPNAQQEITRIATAAFTGSYELADRLAPATDKPDTSQTLRALTENNVCMLQGKPPVVNDDDVDDVHVPSHLDGMIALIQRGTEFNNASFTPQDFQGFQALGTHCVMHIQKVQSMSGTGKKDGNKEKSSAWMQALNEIVNLGEELAHNLKQTQQGSQEQPDPMEIADMQLKLEQLKLSRDKFDFSREKWDRTQLHRENNSAFQQVLANSKDQREAALTRTKMVKTDVETALALKDRNQAAPK